MKTNLDKLPTREQWIEWEKDTFDVTVSYDNRGQIELSITHNGHNWTSIRFLTKEQLKKVVEKCSEVLQQ